MSDTYGILERIFKKVDFEKKNKKKKNSKRQKKKCMKSYLLDKELKSAVHCDRIVKPRLYVT